MANVSNEAIKKTVKQVYAKINPKHTKNVDPNEYLSLMRYPEGPSKWNQKSFWESHPDSRRR